MIKKKNNYFGVNLLNLLFISCFYMFSASCSNEEMDETVLAMDSVSEVSPSVDKENLDEYMPVVVYSISKIEMKKIGSYKNSTGHTIQGAALVGGLVCQFYDGGYYTLSTLDNYASKTPVAKTENSNRHCNAASSYISENGDTLVYTEGLERGTNNINVYRIVNEKELQYVTTATYSGNAGYSHDPVVDGENRKAYFVDYSRATWKDSTNNHMILNSHSFADDYMSNCTIERQVHMPQFLPYFQDAFAMNSRVYVAFGIPSTERGIAVFNVHTENWKCSIYYLSSVLPRQEEPEGIFYKDGYMYMICNTGNLYKILWDEEQMANENRSFDE